MIKKISGFIIKIAAKLLCNTTEFIKRNPVLSLILLLALALRVIGVYPGYPDFHPDEGTSYGKAVTMLYNYLKPDFFDYPAGMPFVHLLIFNFGGAFELLKHINDSYYFSQTTKSYIFGQELINALYWSRYIAAGIGTATVFLTYVVAKKIFNKETALLSAFFLTVNYRHVFGSHFGLPDVHQAFFGMLSLLAALYLLKENSKKRYILSGIVAGIFFSMKYQIFAVFPLIAAHVFWAIKKRNFFYLFHPYIF